MRKFATVAALSVLGIATIVGGYSLLRTPKEAMIADTERDLEMASSVQSPRTGVVSAIEQGGSGLASAGGVAKRALVTVRKRTPTPSVAPTVMEVATAKVVPDDPQLVVAPVAVTVPAPEAPAPVLVRGEAAAAPLDVPNSMPATAIRTGVGIGSREDSHGWGDIAEAGGGYAEADRGTGAMRRGGVAGPMAGAVIRGGFPGHDKCEPVQRGFDGRNNGSSGLTGDRGSPRGTIVGGAMPGGARRW